MPATSCEPAVGGRPVMLDASGGWKSSATSAAPRAGRGRDERARAQVRRQEEHRRRAGPVEVERVGRPRVEEDRPPLATSASRWIRPPAASRATSSIVGGGAAASSSVQIAVSTVDLPLDASPTSAHTEPGVELELARRAIALDRDAPERRRHRSRRPERAEIDGRVARLPAAEEALDRRMEHDVVELGRVEEPVAADGRVGRGDALERAAGEIAGEDDVHDVLRRRTARFGEIESTTATGPSNVRSRPRSPTSSAQLAPQRVDEALAAR